ncbi:MAG: flagellar hook-basal body complex protein FliE [Clostridia bacterium]|nr:flagellar hook-basal body complex protein FliE [Clostridia bacterium]
MSDISTSLVGSYSSISSLLENKLPAASSETETSFADIMSDSLSLFSETGAESDQVTLDLLTGSTEDLSSALISTEKAEIALNLTVAIRNKAVEAYKEIMNMQV